MIVVEGADGSGKSTLVAALSRTFPDWPVHHSGGPPRSQEDRDERERRFRILFEVRPREIWDRVYPISNPIYDQVIRDRILTPAALIEMSSILRGGARRLMIGPPIVYCRPPLDVQMAAIARDDRVKDHETSSHVAMVKERRMELIRVYDTVMTFLSLAAPPVVVYDYTVTAPEVLAEYLRGYLCAA